MTPFLPFANSAHFVSIYKITLIQAGSEWTLICLNPVKMTLWSLPTQTFLWFSTTLSPSWKEGNWNSRGQSEGAEHSARKYSTFISNLIQNGSHWRNVLENGIEIIQIQSAALLSTDSGNSSFLKYLQIQSRGSFRIEHKVTLSDPELHWGMEAAIHS